MSQTHKKSYKRKQYEKMKEKEYTTSYLNQKRDRLEKPNNYPWTRLVLIKDFFKSSDLYKAIALFLTTQIIIITIAAGSRYPDIAGAMNLLAILIGIIVVIFSIREINRRQRNDETRRRFRFSRVIVIIASMYAALFIMTFVFNLFGVSMATQPNQESLDGMLVVFPIAMIFTMVVVSPIIEELVFREMLPFATGPSYLSFIIASIIFIALHAPFGLMGWTTYGILAAGFLTARLIDNNIYTGIAVHMIWNALSVIV